MIIDCDTCIMRDVSCTDCVISALLRPGPGAVELDAVECDALDVLAGGGLIPPLRLVPALGPIGRPAAAARRAG
jgi:hypothetical protein